MENATARLSYYIHNIYVWMCLCVCVYSIIAHSSFKFANPFKPLQSDSQPNIDVCESKNWEWDAQNECEIAACWRNLDERVDGVAVMMVMIMLMGMEVQHTQLKLTESGERIFRLEHQIYNVLSL